MNTTTTYIWIIQSCLCSTYELFNRVFAQTLQSFYVLDFALRLQWIDYRLGFQDLRENPLDNQVPFHVVEQMWTPLLTIRNSLNEDGLQFNQFSSSMILFRNGHGKQSALSQLDEAKVYDPDDITISLQTYHLLKFKCHFDMVYFPFDNQHCFAEVSHFHSTQSS